MSIPRSQDSDSGDSVPVLMDECAAAEALVELLMSSVLASRAAVASMQASEAQALSALVHVAQRQADLSGKRWASERDIPLRSIAADLAAELRVSDTTVQRNLGDAYAITTLFPATRAAWERGEITRTHVNQILTVGSPIIDPARRAGFEAAMLPIARETSASRTGAAARRIVERYMDQSLQARHDVAVARREVRVRDVDDGMAELTATIGAVLAHGIYDRLTQQAHTLRNEATQPDHKVPADHEAPVIEQVASGTVDETPAIEHVASGADDEVPAIERVGAGAGGMGSGTGGVAAASARPGVDTARVGSVAAGPVSATQHAGAASEHTSAVVGWVGAAASSMRRGSCRRDDTCMCANHRDARVIGIDPVADRTDGRRRLYADFVDSHNDCGDSEASGAHHDCDCPDADGVREHAEVQCTTRSLDALRADILTDLLLTGGPDNIADFHDVPRSTLAEIHGIVQVTIPVLTLVNTIGQTKHATTPGTEQGTEQATNPGGEPGTVPNTVPETGSDTEPSEEQWGGPGAAPRTGPRVEPGTEPAGVLCSEPGFLNGRCPIDPDTARRLAGSVPGLDRVMCHPVTGAILAVDRYRPSQELKRFLTARDEHCRFPGCRAPAHRCDIDHTIDAAYGGETSAINLAHLCRRHHTLKHATRWSVTQLPDGILQWTSPTARGHTDRPPSQVRFTPSDDPTTDPDPPPF